MQHEPFHICWAEMEYTCFMVINPNDRMKVMNVHGIKSCSQPRNTSDCLDSPGLPIYTGIPPLGIPIFNRKACTGDGAGGLVLFAAGSFQVRYVTAIRNHLSNVRCGITVMF
jgi:hypothetical protein